MSIITEIHRTIHAIRCAADCDVERLCFEVSDAEWRELLGWLERNSWTPTSKGDVVASGNHLVFMGIRVRKRPPTVAEKRE